MTNASDNVSSLVHLALPKGRMEEGVLALLRDAGIRVTFGKRGYRPTLSLRGFETKILKPQNIVEMLHLGTRDLGFAGADWVQEKGVDLVELLDTELDPVRVVVAALPAFATGDLAGMGQFRIASEYQRLTEQWLERNGLDARVVRTYGATEVFPPEDADCIIDNTATGETLKANGLVIIDEVMRSSTRLYAHPRAMEVPEKRERIERLILLLRSVLDARERVMLEVNVAAEQLDDVIAVLPSMREPTMSPLHGDKGFALKAAVLRKDLPVIIPEIKARGGGDILVTSLAQIVP
ncbi:MAG: ATP phosphoribosyltransferase [Alphaproteobacteria bacterium]